MPEERDLEKSETAQRSQTPDQNQSAQLPISQASFDSLQTSRLDSRIATAASPSEAAEWLLLRGDLIRQEEWIEQRKHERAIELQEGRHQRTMEKFQLAAAYSLSLAALIAAVPLLYTGSTTAGLLCLGAGLYRLAPQFVTRFFGSGRSDHE